MDWDRDDATNTEGRFLRTYNGAVLLIASLAVTFFIVGLLLLALGIE